MYLGICTVFIGNVHIIKTNQRIRTYLGRATCGSASLVVCDYSGRLVKLFCFVYCSCDHV